LAVALEPPKNFVMYDALKPAVAAFEDAQGRGRSLADFKGEVVVLNIWATWCVPCRREMPALDRPQAKLGGPTFEVIPVRSIAAGSRRYANSTARSAHRMLESTSTDPAKCCERSRQLDRPGQCSSNRTGREIGRVVGPAEWDASEIVEFLTRIASAPDDTAQGGDRNRDAASQPPDGTSRLPVARRWLKGLFVK
jgi:thiol-disulfide isomerase/thioredoxin